MTPGNGPYDWRQERDRRRAQKMQWRMQRKMWHSQHRGPGYGHAVAGAILLIIGIVFLLTNLGVFYADDVRKYWPVILIVLGAGQALGYGGRFGGGSGPSPRHLLLSGMWMVMGGLLLAQNFGYIHGDAWQVIWPVILIFLGISFLFRTHWHGTVPPGTPPEMGGAGVAADSPPNPRGRGADSLDEATIFGGINRRIESQEFEGGHLTAVFGGIELDLRKANTKKDEIVIEANAVFGGIELMVPDYWRVTVKGAGVFGGYEDQTRPSSGPLDAKRPHLILTGAAVFGGVSVKN